MVWKTESRASWRAALTVLIVCLSGGVAASTATAVAAQEPSPPDFVQELPDTLTVEEMDAISNGGVIEFISDDPATGGESALSARSVPMKVVNDKCDLDPGIMWNRSSGSGFKYGGIGSKPSLKNCTAGVVETGMATDVYQFNGLFWFKASGPFNSYGTGNMTQTSVMHECTGRGEYLYKGVTTAWGANKNGATGVGRDSTDEFKFKCG